MSSFSRNTTRADSLARPRALCLGLAFTLMSVGALADGAHRFVFTVYGDAMGGTEVIAGRYQAALEELKRHPDSMDIDPAATSTNQCVAYSMTLQWQQARAACDAAVREADAQRTAVPAWLSWTLSSIDDRRALAYTNRAVMHWLSNDEAAAQKDLSRAEELAPLADFVAQNVTALKVHAIVAIAAAPAPKR